MPNHSFVPLDELELMLTDTQEQGTDALKKSNIVPFTNASEQNINKTVLRMKLKRLAMQGTTAVDAAKLLKISTAGVRAIYAEPEFKQSVQQALSEAFEDIDNTIAVESATLEEKLLMQAQESFNALVAMLNGSEHLTANQKIKIHTDFMDRAEATAAKRVNVARPSSAKMDAETLARAAQAGREMDEARMARLKRA
jgi:prophage DNA circulation protein